METPHNDSIAHAFFLFMERERHLQEIKRIEREIAELMPKKKRGRPKKWGDEERREMLHEVLKFKKQNGIKTLKAATEGWLKASLKQSHPAMGEYKIKDFAEDIYKNHLSPLYAKIKYEKS